MLFLSLLTDEETKHKASKVAALENGHSRPRTQIRPQCGHCFLLLREPESRHLPAGRGHQSLPGA